jgi:hypothetical protein
LAIASLGTSSSYYSIIENKIEGEGKIKIHRWLVTLFLFPLFPLSVRRQTKNSDGLAGATAAREIVWHSSRERERERERERKRGREREIERERKKEREREREKERGSYDEKSRGICSSKLRAFLARQQSSAR